MKKTATLLALAGLSMAINPEHHHLHGSFRNNTKPVVDHKPSSDPYVASNQSETLNADDELLLIYKPQYDVDPGMVIWPPRGDTDKGIFVRPQPKNQVMYADDEMSLISKEMDFGRSRGPFHRSTQKKNSKKSAVGHKKSSDVSVKQKDIGEMIIEEPKTITDPELILDPKNDVIDTDNELSLFERDTMDFFGRSRGPFIGRPLRIQADDELIVVGNKKADTGMIIKPKRGDIDSGMVMKPRREAVDPKIILNPKKDVIYADDELILNNPDLMSGPRRGDALIRPRKGDTVFADDELSMSLFDAQKFHHGRSRGPFSVTPPRIQADDELIVVGHKKADPGMVIKPKRGDIDSGMAIKPRREVVDPKIIVNPKKDVIYADDELILNNPDLMSGPRRGDALVRPRKGDTIFADDELLLFEGYTLDFGRSRGPFSVTPVGIQADDELIAVGNKKADAGMLIKPKRGDVDPGMVIKPRREVVDPKIIVNPKKDVIYADDELVILRDLLNN